MITYYYGLECMKLAIKFSFLLISSPIEWCCFVIENINITQLFNKPINNPM